MAHHYTELPADIRDELRKTAEALVAPGKGILAVDDFVPGIGKKFEQLGVPNTEDNRRKYRQLLFTSDRSWADNISGVILFDETVNHRSDDGRSLIQVLQSLGVIPGIKADTGVVPLLGTDNESVTQGLDDLGSRCDKYYRAGCRFAKWRAVIRIGPNEPSTLAVQQNAIALARYAAICQQHRLVPIVEPDVIQDGDHGLDVCRKVTEKVLATVYKALNDHHVYLEGTLLKPNMVTPGQQCKVRASPEEIAEATVTALQRTVPVSVPGIVFLSGGLTEEESSVNLNAINQLPSRKPWRLTFSFGRALQASAMKAWSGRDVDAGQREFLKRAIANSLACQGKYRAGSVTSVASDQTNFRPTHVY